MINERVQGCIADTLTWGYGILLFLICFFCHFVIRIGIDYQNITNNQ